MHKLFDLFIKVIFLHRDRDATFTDMNWHDSFKVLIICHGSCCFFSTEQYQVFDYDE